MNDTGDNPISIVPTISLANLMKAAIGLGVIIAAFYAIISGVKGDIAAESKANSRSIYDLQVELAVEKTRMDTLSAEVKTIREDEKQTYKDINANLNQIIKTVTEIQITVASSQLKVR